MAETARGDAARRIELDLSAYTAAEAAAWLGRKRSEGFDHVTFMGVEPCAHASFVTVLSVARGLGYRVRLVTAGERLGDPAFAERVAPGLDEVCVPVHGLDDSAHDSVAATRHGFTAAAAALRALCRRPSPPRLITHTIVGTMNVTGAVATVRWLLASGCVSEALVSSVPAGPWGRRRAELSLAAWTPLIAELAQAAAPLGRPVRVLGLPLCAFGPHGALSGDLYEAPPGISAAPRRHTGACSSCAAYLCRGAAEDYLYLRGESELRPLSA